MKVLITVHPNLDTLDLTGPLEILSHATHPTTTTTPPAPAFNITITSASPLTTTGQGLTFQRHIPIPDVYSTLSTYDILIIPGGASSSVLEGHTEPLHLIKAFASLPKREDGRARILFSVCTGSLFLAEAGVLDGLTVTTHPEYYGKLREILHAKVEGEGKGEGDRTMVVEERFVVNRTDEEGLRVVTAGGVSSGIDGALWVVGELVGRECKEGVEGIVQHAYRSGVVL
ncbi:class I glutamine amidotransferase-like protein [Hyaloscypha hepaticicola]|uniref:Class I glutamine amidotransferase-like protein n=1 Tax=Hyaloscypha hepaticicola TaxID=2082293 RepID=A0A2J6PJ97_9HELO|nr:class I glutamine amidotransferase-like protein [Hyaloscypha hepaticicola]